jgi:hypothetical protein
MSIDSEWRFAMREYDRETKELRRLNAELLEALKTHLLGHLKSFNECPQCLALIAKAEDAKGLS